MKLPALLLIAICAFLMVFYYVRYSTLSRRASLFLWTGTVIVAAAWVFIRLARGRRSFHSGPEGELMTLGGALCLLLAVPFIVRLWSKWVQGDLTEAERTPGAASWRAWMAGGNIIPALLIAVLAWWSFGLSLPLMLFTTLGALAVYPAIITATADEEPGVETSGAANDNMAGEREKILSMLESGKITAVESTELLNALGATLRRPESAPVPMTGSQRLVLIGAGVLLIGFLLPWMVINPGKQLNRAMQQMTSSVIPTQGFPAMPEMMGQLQMNMPLNFEVKITGGSLRGGLGWVALGLGFAAAFVPYAARSMDYETQRLVRFLALGGGAIIILYVLFDDPRSVGIGLIIAALGIAMEFIGVVRERKKIA